MTEVEAVTVLVSTNSALSDDPLGIRTLDGTGNAGLSLDRLTEAPPLGAGPLRVIASSAKLPPGTLADVMDTEVRLGNTTGVKVTLAVLVEPLYAAVIVTEVEVVTAAVCTDRSRAVAPPGTETLEGAGKAALELVRVTEAPPGGAGPLRVIASCAVEPPFRLAGVTASVDKVGSTTGVTVTDAVLLAPL